MDENSWKKYIFNFPGGDQATMKAPSELLVDGLGNDSKWIYFFNDDGSLEKAVALHHVLSIEVEDSTEEEKR